MHNQSLFPPSQLYEAFFLKVIFLHLFESKKIEGKSETDRKREREIDILFADLFYQYPQQSGLG